MTTDEMILALVAKHGFRLPDDVEAVDDDGTQAFALRGDGEHSGKRVLLVLADQQAHDLCAAEFARQAKARSLMQVSRMWRRFKAARIEGDSPAAIEAIWKALQ